jgi:hypothetical protein
MASVTGTLTAVGQQGASLYLRSGETCTVAVSRTGVGAWAAQLVTAAQSKPSVFTVVETFQANASGYTFVNQTDNALLVAVQLRQIQPAESVSFTIADVVGDQILEEWRAADGTLAFRITDQGPVGGIVGSTLDVRAFGAKGDGVTDDTAAIQAASDAAALAGTPLVFPAGTYKVNTSITTQGDYDLIQWVAQGNVIIDGTASTAAQLITLGGTADTPVALTASPSRGALQISSTLASSVVKGDIVFIQSTDAFGPSSVFNTKGEFAEVEAASGGVITLRTALYDSYTDSTTTVRKVNAPRVRLDNIRVLRDSTHDGLEVRYARDIYLLGVRVSGARRSGLDLWYCVGGVLENCGSDDVFGTDTGLQYGLSVNSSQWLTTIGGTYYGGRHAIAHGGSEPTRGVSLFGVTCAGDMLDATATTLDFHDNTEFCVVEGCTIFGGIVGEGRNLTIKNNRFQRTISETTVNWEFAASFGYFVFSGNFFESNNAGTGIRFTFDQPNVTIGLLDISDNYGIGNTTISIADGGQAGAAITKLKLHGNIVNAASTNQALSVGGSGATLVIGEAEIIGGTYQSAGSEAVTFRPASTSRTLKAIGTQFRATGDFRPFGVFNVTHVIISGCRVEGNGFATSSFVQDAVNVVLRDNYFFNCGANGGFSLLLSVLSATLCQESGNVLDTCTGAFNASAGGIYVDYRDNTGRRVGRGTAAPAAGAWLQGDTVWNTAPAAGGIPGWMCTTAGTPGTWKAMADLAP